MSKGGFSWTGIVAWGEGGGGMFIPSIRWLYLIGNEADRWYI